MDNDNQGRGWQPANCQKLVNHAHIETNQWIKANTGDLFDGENDLFTSVPTVGSRDEDWDKEEEGGLGNDFNEFDTNSLAREDSEKGTGE